jgi:hypothetical protein
MMKRFMPSKLVPRIILFVVAISALICGWLVYRGTASPTAVEVALPGDSLDDREPLGEQEMICEQLIHSLGGDHAILIPVEWLPLDCGTYPRPEGLEFMTEKSKSGGAREVTEIIIGHPENANLDLQIWRDATTRAIAKLPSLRTLAISSEAIGSEGIAQFGVLPKLRELQLYGVVTDTMLSSIGELQKLETLSIDAYSSRGLTDRGLEQFANLPALRKLRLGSCSVREDVFSGLQNLRAITLIHCEISPEAYLGLGKCVNLDRFELSGDGAISDACAAALGGLPHLRHVAIYTELSDDNLRALSASRSIEDLSLRHCDQLTEAGFSALEPLPLKSIELWGASADQLARLKSSFPNLTIVTKP